MDTGGDFPEVINGGNMNLITHLIFEAENEWSLNSTRTESSMLRCLLYFCGYMASSNVEFLEGLRFFQLQ